MQHTEQRLLERAVPAEAERAFILLRNRQLLERVVNRFLGASAPNADRVALPLADGEDVPRLVVTRDGHAVTCLGRGMSARLPQLNWPEVRAILEFHQEQLRRGRAQSLLDREAHYGEAMRHGLRFGHRMTRAEWNDLRMLTPLLEDLLQTLGTVAVKVLKLVKRSASRRGGMVLTEELCRRTWGAFVALGWLMMAFGPHPLVLRLALAMDQHGDIFLGMRSSWILVNHPEETLALAEELQRRGRPALLTWMLGALEAIAWRFSWHRREARDALVALSRTLDDPRCEADLTQDFLSPCVQDLVLRELPLLLPSTVPADVPAVDLRRGTADARRARKDGQALAAAAGRMGPWAMAAMTEWAPLQDAFKQPAPFPTPPSLLDDTTRRRHRLWREAQQHCRTLVDGNHPDVVALFSCAPMDALLPDEQPEEALSAPRGVEYFQVHLPEAYRAAPREDQGPVKHDVKVGRNEPCPCGSGKKFKKCCSEG